MNSSISTSIDPNEIEKFSKMADEWWDEKGKFKPLHKFNPIRLKYIVETIKEQFFLSNSYLPLNGLKILDVGCGGGLLCEPLARLGASVTGIDMSEKTISIASLHAKKENLDIEYLLLLF
jgi:2-polyprenyl-6-hydroxyphenyl methylase/3-demethylubiquinone-9 3-methyltransferase